MFDLPNSEPKKLAEILRTVADRLEAGEKIRYAMLFYGDDTVDENECSFAFTQRENLDPASFEREFSQWLGKLLKEQGADPAEVREMMTRATLDQLPEGAAG